MLLTLILGGCAQSSYLLHLAEGHLGVLRARTPIDEVMRAESTDAALKQRLGLVLDARAFATAQLQLPDNGSYRDYADLGRPYVLWNLYATDEFSIQPHLWCYPLMGCFAYRGYYDEARSMEAEQALRTQGYDVYRAGVAAYSTLGWFDDPVLNTMMRWGDHQLVGTLFHELAHQQLFVKNDTAFNESFASFVETRGLLEYQQRHPGRIAAADPASHRDEEFVSLVLETRQRLAQLYASGLPTEQMRQRKTEAFEDLRARYRRLRDDRWAGYDGYDRWFEQPLNNARLLPFGLYDHWQPAFSELFEQQHGDWQAFYLAAKQLGALKPEARNAELTRLLTASESR